ncbi:MAG: PEGA domain-containing protein [Planctomycetes bacterium]|nr:PEGA domain-containing protein [Planctomycetota bacterium]
MFVKKALCVWLAMTIVLAPGCNHSSRIITDPEGAEVEIDNIYVGTTPLHWPSRSGLPDTAYIKITKEGYEPIKNGILRKAYRADLSLLLLLAAIFPYFFSARFEDDYRFALKPLPGTQPPQAQRSPAPAPQPPPPPPQDEDGQ